MGYPLVRLPRAGVCLAAARPGASPTGPFPAADELAVAARDGALLARPLLPALPFERSAAAGVSAGAGEPTCARSLVR